MNKMEKRRLKKAAKKTARKSKPARVSPIAARQQPAQLQDIINRAVQLHTAGNLQMAEGLYKEVLAVNPEHPIVLHLLGVVAHQSGNNQQAVNLISKSLGLKPDYAEALNNLGIVYKALNRRDEAKACYQKAISLNPNYAEAHYNLGNILGDLIGPDQAVKSYRRAIALKPDYADALNNLGMALYDLGQYAEAITPYEQALVHKTDFADAQYNMGKTLQELGRWQEAIHCYEKAIAVNPKFAKAHNNLGNILKDQNIPDRAAACYRTAIQLKPQDAEAHNNLAIILQDMGRFEEAITCYRQAIALKDDYTQAHKHLALIIKHTGVDEDIQTMETLISRPELTNPQKVDLAFALGKSYEDLKAYDQAFSYFALGNRLKRQSFSYSKANTTDFIDTLKSTFDTDMFASHPHSGCSDTTPIFILGMPRSGTTLVEQILASHPHVYGAGELAALSQTLSPSFEMESPDFSNQLHKAPSADFDRAGSDYISELRKITSDARHVTDKMPDNFKLIGLIKLCVPNAKVIHCRRNPMDTCLSIFKTDFTGTHPYAYDQDELGHYYKCYEDLMAYWHYVMPGYIHDLSYEKMVDDPTEQTQALLAFCGLEWDNACLEFYNTDRPVKTASATQVRKPIYRDSLELWKRYEHHLQPLRDSLVSA